jgi:hypothetical protein
MPFCPRCDTENAPEALVCVNCGSSMSTGTLMMSVGSVPRPKVSIRVVRADGGPETTVNLKREEAICGASGDILLLDDPFVARHQARLFFHGPRLMVEDVGGGNGVFTRIRTERELAFGGEMRCGRQRLQLEAMPPVPQGQQRMWGSPDESYRARLIQLLEGGRRGDAFPLHEGENLVGRESGDIAFPGDGFVSGRHAIVTVRSDRVTIKDVGSSNGTFIRLGQPTALESNDQLLIGRQLLRVEIAAA